MSIKRTILKKCPISGFADEINPSIDKQIALLRDLEINYIEFRSGEGINVADYTVEQAQALKEKLDANGIKVSALGSPIGKIKITDDFAPHLEKLYHVMEIAKILGTDKIRIFSFFMPKGEDPSNYKEEVFYRTKAMISAAASQNMVLLHENEKGIYGDNVERCLELMESFCGDNYRCTFDFANFVECGQNPLEAYQMLAPYVNYVHIKDAKSDSGQVVLPGKGDGRLKEVLELLNQAGYEGFLSLEPHLTDFIGLKDLEEAAETRGRNDGEAAFSEAYAALAALLQ